MNVELVFESMDADEITYMERLIADYRDEMAQDKADSIRMLPEEKKLALASRVYATLAVRLRTGCTLRTALAVLDREVLW